MAQKKQADLSSDIKVEIVGNIPFIDHSEAYNALQERYLSDEKFTKQQKAANSKFMDAEDVSMEEARRDPVAFIKQQQAKLEQQIQASDKAITQPNDITSSANEKPNATAPSPDTLEMPPLVKNEPNQQTGMTGAIHDPQQNPSKEQRHDIAEYAFAEAKPENLAIALKNLDGVQQKLLATAEALKTAGIVMTPEQMAKGLEKAYIDEGAKLHELNVAANIKENALTWEVANFAQGAGKTMVSGDVGGNTTGMNVGGEVHHGVKVPGLDLAEVNASSSTTNEGVVSGSAGVRAVKNVYSNGDHNVFLAAAANMTASNLTGDTQLGGNLTGLVVNTHTLGGRPTSEIGGASVDLLTGNTTLIGSVAQTFNADTKYATTARAIGTVGAETGSGGFSLEAYQRTGIESLTARLNAGVADVGGENEPSAGAGVSYSW